MQGFFNVCDPDHSVQISHLIYLPLSGFKIIMAFRTWRESHAMVPKRLPSSSIVLLASHSQQAYLLFIVPDSLVSCILVDPIVPSIMITGFIHDPKV